MTAALNIRTNDPAVNASIAAFDALSPIESDLCLLSSCLSALESALLDKELDPNALHYLVTQALMHKDDLNKVYFEEIKKAQKGIHPNRN